MSERKGGWGESYCCQRARGGGRRGGGRAWERERVACLLVFVGMWMCERVHARLRECMCADTWHSPHIVESFLPVCAVLHLSLLPSFPFYSLPLSFVLFTLPFSSLHFVFSLFLLSSFFFVSKISLTMVQDFYCLDRRANDWQRWVGWIRGDGWICCLNVGISEFFFKGGEWWKHALERATVHLPETELLIVSQGFCCFTAQVWAALHLRKALCRCLNVYFGRWRVQVCDLRAALSVCFFTGVGSVCQTHSRTEVFAL